MGVNYFRTGNKRGGAKWLGLYCSDFDGENVTYRSEVVAVNDDPQKVAQHAKDGSVNLYRDATTAEGLFKVWKETYALQMRGDLIFDEEASAYNIEVIPLRKKHLKEFSPDDNIVNRFEEILRHNNVSDKENAFNRLIALFICKLVDEITKQPNDIVDFQYKEGSDDYESLQDRLQRLHKTGMKEFMREEVFYVPANYSSQLFKNYTGLNRENAIKNLEHTIRALKYYSNNDFAFKDVHNEELFYQNGKVLVEVVQLFERFQIVYGSKHQFLGDLFEQLLNKGFKQNEGQFFTPMPITRFIWDSLPLAQYFKSDKDARFPKIIDYACGAGHFLTEAIAAVNEISDSGGDNSWVGDHIYGVEKDYRLARVSKVSLFMNGAGDGNIVFGDGLDNAPEQGIGSAEFDILVANPPYSVSSFKQHLNLRSNALDLLEYISDSGSEIEVLFVERLVQLLKPGGVAAVILPSSILSKNNRSYIHARRCILENFQVKGIVELGSSTFGETGTQTVVLFLEKNQEPPKRIQLVSDSIDALMTGNILSDWEDGEIFDLFTKKIEVEPDFYLDFLLGKHSLECLESTEYFRGHVKRFRESKTFKSISKSAPRKGVSSVDVQRKLLEQFYRTYSKIEKEKLRYFGLTYNQSTTIVHSPKSKKELQNFLGYKWSKRKGSEGIQIINAGGMLYAEEDRLASTTLASALRSSFDGSKFELPREVEGFVKSVRTSDMLEFFGAEFDNSLSTIAERSITIATSLGTRSLQDVEGVQIRRGTTITEASAGEGNIKVVAGGREHAYTTDSANRKPPVITISGSGANAGFVNYWEEPIFASDCITVQTDGRLETAWLYEYLKYLEPQIIAVLQLGSSQPHVYPKDIQRIPVPEISIEVKKEIVKRCEESRAEARLVEEQKLEVESQIADLFGRLDRLSKTNRAKKYRVSDSDVFEMSIGKRVLESQLVPKDVSERTVPVYSANVKEPFGWIEETLNDDFSRAAVIWGIDGDWMVNYLPANVSFRPTDHCGVLYVDPLKINPRYMAHILEVEGSRRNFSRSKRPSLDRISSLQISVPDPDIQNSVVDEILALEIELRRLQNVERELKGQPERLLRDQLHIDD